MIYLDTSAAVKVLIEEPDTRAVLDLFSSRDDLVSSRLLEVELHAVASRRGVSEDAVRAVVDRIALVRLDDEVARRAVHLRSGLRPFDALHLATALELGPVVAGLVCYDQELTDAAALRGIRILALPLDDAPSPQI